MNEQSQSPEKPGKEQWFESSTISDDGQWATLHFENGNEVTIPTDKNSIAQLGNWAVESPVASE